MTGLSTDAAQVRFSDGDIHEVAELTNSDVAAMAAAAKAARSGRGEPLWSGVHTASGEAVTIKPRADRQMLTPVNLGQALKCMVKTSLFGGDHDKAAGFLQPIAIKICSGELSTKTEIYALRDKLLAEATNLSVPDADEASASARPEPGPEIKKRPASANTTSAASTPVMKRPAIVMPDAEGEKKEGEKKDVLEGEKKEGEKKEGEQKEQGSESEVVPEGEQAEQELVDIPDDGTRKRPARATEPAKRSKALRRIDTSQINFFTTAGEFPLSPSGASSTSCSE